jgi:hypothetical protein
MHLHGYPKYYVKGEKRRAVYYTAEARDLVTLGWKPEAEATVKKEAPAKAVELPKIEKPVELPAVETIEAELVDDQPEVVKQEPQSKLPDFDFMTKAELLQYALDRGVDLPNNILKAELVKACRELGNV